MLVKDKSGFTGENSSKVVKSFIKTLIGSKKFTAETLNRKPFSDNSKMIMYNIALGATERMDKLFPEGASQRSWIDGEYLSENDLKDYETTLKDYLEFTGILTEGQNLMEKGVATKLINEAREAIFSKQN